MQNINTFNKNVYSYIQDIFIHNNSNVETTQNPSAGEWVNHSIKMHLHTVEK